MNVKWQADFIVEAETDEEIELLYALQDFYAKSFITAKVIAPRKKYRKNALYTYQEGVKDKDKKIYNLYKEFCKINNIKFKYHKTEQISLNFNFF